MPEWFLGPPHPEGAAVPSRTLLRTEVSDTAGAVLVETRRLGTPEEEAGDDGQSARWEAAALGSTARRAGKL